MKRWQVVLPLLFLSVVLAAGISSAASNPEASPLPTAVFPENAAINQLQAGPDALHFQLSTPSLTLDSHRRLTAAGLDDRLRQSGVPDLPIYTTYLALPPAGSASVTISAGATVHTSVDIDPVPSYTGADPELGLPPTEVVLDRSTAVYNTDTLFPEKLYSLSEPMYYRDLRVVRLQLYPLRYQPLSQTLHHHAQLDVVVTFESTAVETPTAQTAVANFNFGALSGQLLNPNQAAVWRSLPPELTAAASSFPTDADTIFKLTVTHDDIYTLTGAEMLAAGLPVGTEVNRLAMMQNGEPVHFTYDDAGTTGIIDNDDVLRFYGFTFDGSKRESLYMPGTRRDDGFDLHNVFWLYVDDSAVSPSPIISPIDNLADQSGTDITTATAHTVVWEPEDYFFSTWTNAWDTFPNEPDVWFADYIPEISTKAYTITVPNPASSGPATTAKLTVEFMGAMDVNSTVKINLNQGTSITDTLDGNINLNITQDIEISQIQNGNNSVEVKLSQGSKVYINDINLTYQRTLQADSFPFAFQDEVGARELVINLQAGLSNNEVLAWDVTNVRQPGSVAIKSGDISGNLLYVDIDQAADSQFIVTTTTDTTAVDNITPYTSQDLTPTGGSAEWLIITPAEFAAAANSLANHRQDGRFGGFTTHVADYDAIINQYGYGLALPAAIQAYLSDALANWGTQYVVLMGDATVVPRATTTPMPCPAGCRSNWDASAPTYLITDVQFIDAYQGMVPTDHTFATLSGDDMLADLAIGRLPAETQTDAQWMVDKIISYETAQLSPQDWMLNILFVADDTDPAGNFFSANQIVARTLPSVFNITEMGLPDDPEAADVDDLYESMILETSAGTSILNYRGHGAIPNWTDNNRSNKYNKGPLLSASDDDFWANFGKPTIVLSADCLDGYFAYPGETAISEAFLKLDGIGSVAHWSSTGLGFTTDHTILHRAFYEGVFEADQIRIGDATNYSKAQYIDAPFKIDSANSEVFKFTLQGDPAMRVFTPFQSRLYLPSIIK